MSQRQVATAFHEFIFTFIIIIRALHLQIQMQKHPTQSQANKLNTNPYVQYVNRFKQITPIPTSLAHFNDGLVLLELIRMITDMRIEGEVQDTPKTFFHRFSNLKLLFHSLQHFWQRVLGCPLTGDEIDLVLIAHTASPPQTEKLLELFVKTAAQAQNKYLFIEKILQTSQATQEYLKQIIETVITHHRDSPRKEKEKRMYDKIMELDHENEKLQQVIEEICEEKLQFENRLKTLTDKLEDRNKQIQKLQTIVNQEMYTPQKRKIIGVPDTIDRKDNQIESLRQQMLEMSALHEKELQQCFHEMEKMVDMTSHFELLKQQLERSKETAENNRETNAEAQRTLATLKAELISKENIASLLKERLEKSQRRALELERAEMTTKTQLQRRNVQITELNSKVQYLERRLSPIKGEQSRSSTLYLEFPGLAEAETDVYIETNRNLREELERTRRKLESHQGELDQCRRSLDSLKNCEQQNRKLREMVLDLKSHRGEEIDILVGSLHYLRRLIPKESREETALKDCNGVSRSLFAK